MSNNALHMWFPKNKVLDTLKINREKHKKAYQNTVDNWLTSVLGGQIALQKAIVKESEKVVIKDVTSALKVLKELDAPINFLPAYDRAIEMLELTQDESIQMDANQFKEYMKDEWSWKEQWRYSNTKYGVLEDFDG